MKYHGVLKKMKTQHSDTIEYYLDMKNDFLNLNQLLDRKLAVIALDKDVEYAKEFGWTKVLLEVSAQKRKTNFEQATDVQEAYVTLDELADQLPKEYKDLFSAILDQYSNNEFPEIEFTADEEFADQFQDQWL